MPQSLTVRRRDLFHEPKFEATRTEDTNAEARSRGVVPDAAAGRAPPRRARPLVVERDRAPARGRRAPVASADSLAGLDRRPALPIDLERELVAAAQSGDARARARLVEAFTPLIASVARVYRDSPRIDRVELLQEGVVGLLRALERYDASRGTPFWAYAAWWVRQAMQQLVAELTGA